MSESQSVCLFISSCSGITKYSEFTSRMSSSHRRILQNVSQDVFNSQVVNKFSLVLTDENIRANACDLGWQDEWLITNRRRPKAPPPKSGDLTQMFVAQSSVPVVRSPGLLPAESDSVAPLLI